MSADRDFSRELYPFLHAATDGEPGGSVNLLESVRASTLAKCAEVVALRREVLAEYEEQMHEAAHEMARRFSLGGKLLAFGNGGSATDADDAAIDCMTPWRPDWRPLPAMSLAANSATITALANDVDMNSVFARQIGALATRGDIALGVSTSGDSGNVITAFTEAKRRGLLTIALTGYNGGGIAASGAVDFCFVARREFVPRIQEAHATVWHTLLDLIHAERARAEGVA